MKIQLSQHPAGVIVCQVTEGLSDGELSLLDRGIAKFLTNGKCRIVVEIGPGVPEASLSAIRKILEPQAALARRLGGDIRFAKGGADSSGPAGVQAAILTLTGGSQGEPKDAALLTELRARVHQLEQETLHLRERLEEALRAVSEPSTDRELRDSLEFYKKLAEAAEQNREPLPVTQNQKK